MNAIEQYESHEVWLERQQALIDEANPVDYWTGEPEFRRLGYSRRDWWYWVRWYWTLNEQVFTWIRDALETFLIEVGKGAGAALRNPFIVVPLAFFGAVVFMFMLGLGVL